MPIPPRLTSLALVTATVLTAAGLNLTVMQRTASNGGSIAASSGAAATSDDQPAAEQAAPADGTVARTGSPPGDGNGPALDVAARFTQTPSAADPADSAAAMPAPVPVDPSTSASSAPATVAPPTAAPATAPPSAPGPAPDPAPSAAPAPPTSSRPAPSPATAPPTVAVTQPAPTATPAGHGSSSTQPPATEYVTVGFAGVADVIVAFHNRSTVEFWAAWPKPGWAYRVEEDRPGGVKIKFRPTDGGDEAELSIRPEGGELSVKKEY